MRKRSDVVLSRKKGGRMLFVTAAFVLLAASVSAMTPRTMAEPFTGSLGIRDSNDVERNYFDPTESVYFYITAYDAGAPLQYADVDVEVVGDTNGLQFSDTVQTDAYGHAETHWFGGYGAWEHPVDRYTVYVNYTTANVTTTIATGVFRVYDPVPWGGNIYTTDENDIETSFFGTTSEVVIHFHVVDQYGNPYQYHTYGDVYYIVYHNSEFVTQHTLYTDVNGNDTDYFHPYSYYSEPEIYGEYTIRMYNSDDVELANTTFTVISLEITISPEKDPYAQGDEITITVHTSLEGNYIVNITNETRTEIPGARWIGSGESWQTTYTLPATLADGVYHVEVWQNTVFMGMTGFSVKLFLVSVETNKEVYLPGEEGRAFFFVISNHDGTPYPADVKVTLEYYDDTYDWLTKDVGSVHGSSGTVSFTVPNDVLLDSTLTIRATATDGDREDSDDRDIKSGHLRVEVETEHSTYTPGESMVITVQTWAEHTYGGYGYSWSDRDPVGGVEIVVNGTRSGENIDWLHLTGTTNSMGEFNVLVEIPEGAEGGEYMLNATGTFTANRDMEDEDTTTFTIDTDPIAYIEAYFNQTFYVSGQDVALFYTVYENGTRTNASLYYTAEIYTSGSNLVIAEGPVEQNPLNVALPDDIEGELTISLYGMTENEKTVQKILSTDVYMAVLMTSTPTDQYLPGDVLTVHYQLLGDSVSDGFYEIKDGGGYPVARGDIASGENSGEITYTVPQTDESTTYTFEIYIQGNRDVYSDTVAFSETTGYIFKYHFDSTHYKPGDTVTIHYEIIPLGNPPELIGGVYISRGLAEDKMETTRTDQMSGTVTMEIPSDMPDGKYLVLVDATAGGTHSYSDVRIYTQGYNIITVDSKAGPLAYETIGGMQKGSFIATLLGITALVVGLVATFLALRKGGEKAERKKGPGAKSFPQPPNVAPVTAEQQSMTPPAPEPETPGMPPTPTEEVYGPPGTQAGGTPETGENQF